MVAVRVLVPRDSPMRFESLELPFLMAVVSIESDAVGLDWIVRVRVWFARAQFLASYVPSLRKMCLM